ncbi:DUF3305 domain-containing protein [Pararhizobium haloflavum]|uniref:DUF3305 domain-containing protein n=1 Tax=Pararhizobium haloflavum TaxID=2037914 RepID=UPI000C178C0D|nr:DUF3305 domain-containing protein [Pararhizobium haloflavum]
MPKVSRRVGVITVSRKPVTRWAKRGFAPSAALPDVPETEPGTRLGPAGDVESYYAGAHAITLYSGETAHYRDNLVAGPSLWISMRPDSATGVMIVTADPYEGEALAGDPGFVVEAVSMPAAIRDWVADFVAVHHVEHVFEKRKRRRADPDALTRGGKRVLDKDEYLP